MTDASVSVPLAPIAGLPVWTVVVPCRMLKSAMPTTKPKRSSEAWPSMIARSVSAPSSGLNSGRISPVAVAQLIFSLLAAVVLFTSTVPLAMKRSPSTPTSDAPASEACSPMY